MLFLLKFLFFVLKFLLKVMYAIYFGFFIHMTFKISSISSKVQKNKCILNQMPHIFLILLAEQSLEQVLVSNFVIFILYRGIDSYKLVIKSWGMLCHSL